eukprot:8437239-Alexandrium_andersonii.AAC.1
MARHGTAYVHTRTSAHALTETLNITSHPQLHEQSMYSMSTHRDWCAYACACACTYIAPHINVDVGTDAGIDVDIDIDTDIGRHTPRRLNSMQGLQQYD